MRVGLGENALFVYSCIFRLDAKRFQALFPIAAWLAAFFAAGKERTSAFCFPKIWFMELATADEEPSEARLTKVAAVMRC